MPIYCINLKNREDRKKHSLEQFKKIGIYEHQVIYPDFVKDPRGGIYGCFDSHIKIWNDFNLYYPNQTFAIVFEDDFVSPSEGNHLLKMASAFIEENDVDILFLHNLCVPLEDAQNNKLFTKGYGACCHAYLISRRFIETIIHKNGSLPEANGRHIDYENSINFVDKNNSLYSEKLFYTTEEMFMQQVGKSDNTPHMVDHIYHFIGVENSDRNKEVNAGFAVVRFLKKLNIISDKNTKQFLCSLYNIFFTNYKES